MFICWCAKAVNRQLCAPCVALLGALLLVSGHGVAAEVPPGTKLAAQQEITVGNGAEPASLDPHKTEGAPEFRLVIELFEGLVGHDADGKLVPGVAEKWESKEGGKLWLFSLRKDARWSDGSPVTAADFEYSLKRVVDPKTASPMAWYPGKVSNILNAEAITAGRKPPGELGVKALSPTQLQITLEQPVAYFLNTLVHNSLFPVPRKHIEQHGEKWTEADKLVGNGPYRLAERVVNERIVFVRNTHYWNNAKSVIEKAVYVPVANPSAEFQRYRANDLDLTSDGGVPAEQLAQIRRDLAKELQIWPQTASYFYTFNTRRPPFDDARVRRALALALNREVIVHQVLQGGQQPAYGMTPLIAEAYKHQPGRWERASQAERDAEAKRLLLEAGFGPSKPLKFALLYNTSEAHKKLALAAAAMWKRIGPVEVELQNQEWKTYLDTRNRGEFSVSRAGWVGSYNEPSIMLGFFHTHSGVNDGKYSNPKYDELLDRARVTADPAARGKLYAEAEAILAEDAPAAFVHHYANQRLIKPWLKGHGRNPIGWIQLKDLYVVAH